MKLYSHRILIILGFLLLAVAGILGFKDCESRFFQPVACITRHHGYDSRFLSAKMFSKKLG